MAPIGSKTNFLSLIVDQLLMTRRMLRYAPRFHRKNLEKNRQKIFNQKIFHKKIQKIFREFFFQIFFGYHGSTSNLEHACENLGSLGPLVWEEIENEQTVHKGLAKLLYRFE
jgi:hypothetical protein